MGGVGGVASTAGYNLYSTPVFQVKKPQRKPDNNFSVQDLLGQVEWKHSGDSKLWIICAELYVLCMIKMAWPKLKMAQA